MTDISIRRKHGKTHSEARAASEHMASELKEEFGLNYAWDGDVLRFKRSGVSGELALDEVEVAQSHRNVQTAQKLEMIPGHALQQGDGGALPLI